MKRIISFIVCVLSIVALASYCFAEIDLKGLSTDELLDLRKQIDSELSDRKDGGIYAGDGDYYCPDDIDAGSYILNPVPIDEWGSSFFIYDKDGNFVQSGNGQRGETVKIKISDGDKLEITAGFTITKASKISF